jgi:hypothetical protein
MRESVGACRAWGGVRKQRVFSPQPGRDEARLCSFRNFHRFAVSLSTVSLSTVSLSTFGKNLLLIPVVGWCVATSAVGIAVSHNALAQMPAEGVEALPSSIPDITPTSTANHNPPAAPLFVVARDGPFGARTLFKGANPAYTNVADSALCIQAATYKQSKVFPQNCQDQKCQNSQNPPSGSVADVNLRKACELRLAAAGRPCSAARVSYQVILASTGVFESPNDNWVWSWSASASTWYRVRADGALIFRWNGATWKSVSSAIASADGVPRLCNGWVWSGYSDQVNCACG